MSMEPENHSAVPPARPTAVGLIGVGRHGMRYVRHLLHDIPTAQLRAIARQSAAKGVPDGLPPSVRVYDSAERLLADPEVQAAVAVVPPTLNPSIAEHAARVGVPLLLEKPLAASLAQADRIMSVSAAGTPLMIAHTLRFNAALCAFQQQLVDCLHLYQPRTLSLQLVVPLRPKPPQNPGFAGRGAWLDLGVHIADLLLWWLRPRHLTVQSAQIVRGADGVETSALVHIVTDEGIICTLNVAWEGTRRVGAARLEGEQGWLAVDWTAHRLTWGTAHTQLGETVVDEQPTVQACLHAFLHAVRTGAATMPVPLDAGYQALRVVEAGYRAESQPVRLSFDV